VADNKDCASILLDHSREFLDCLTHVDAILDNCKKPISPVGPIRPDLRSCDAKEVPSKKLNRSPIVLVIVEHINVRRRCDGKVNRPRLEREYPGVLQICFNWPVSVWQPRNELSECMKFAVNSPVWMGLL
jgi:hypothetical protein